MVVINECILLQSNNTGTGGDKLARGIKGSTGKDYIYTEVPKKKFKRYRVEESNSRVIEIDFRCIRSVGFKSVDYGNRRNIRWSTPEQLQYMVDEYFASCYGVIYNSKTGLPFYDEKGFPRIGQVKPFTLSGLALQCHVDTYTLKKWSAGKMNTLGYPTNEDYIGPQYSDIINEARKKIEAFAEERLYDRDGFNGGRFVLDCAFKWRSGKEEAEIENMEKQHKLKKKEFKLRRDSYGAANEMDEDITINIVRATKDE